MRASSPAAFVDHSDAPRFEYGQRLAEGAAGGRALLGSPLRRPQGEQRPRPLERHHQALVRGERTVESGACCVMVALLGGEQPAAACGGRERGDSTERARALLEPFEHRDRLHRTAEADQRLDLVGDEASGAGLTNPRRLQLLAQRGEH